MITSGKQKIPAVIRELRGMAEGGCDPRPIVLQGNFQRTLERPQLVRATNVQDQLVVCNG